MSPPWSDAVYLAFQRETSRLSKKIEDMLPDPKTRTGLLIITIHKRMKCSLQLILYSLKQLIIQKDDCSCFVQV